MKKYKVSFSPGSIKDIEEAVEYYNALSQGLGNKFLVDFNVTYKAIELNPLFASVKYDEVRCAAFRRFPFSIHYTVDKRTKSVIIAAVFNTWKNPLW